MCLVFFLNMAATKWREVASGKHDKGTLFMITMIASSLNIMMSYNFRDKKSCECIFLKSILHEFSNFQYGRQQWLPKPYLHLHVHRFGDINLKNKYR